jgi:ribonuclease P protein subunit RPR2
MLMGMKTLKKASKRARKPRNDSGQRRLARERIERLFWVAERDFAEHPERSHRNVALARKIAMRYRIRIPARFRERFCHKCYKYLSRNVNCRVSRRGDTVKVRCLECGCATKQRPAK